LLAHYRHQPRHDDRGEARRHVVDQKHLRPGEQGLGEHLLLAARQKAGPHGPALHQFGEEPVGFGELGFRMQTDAKVFFRGQLAEDGAPLLDMGESGAGAQPRLLDFLVVNGSLGSARR